MTFISKLPQLFLKAFFGTFIMLFAFLSVQAQANGGGGSFLGVLFLAFLLLNPFKKAKEVFGPTDLNYRLKPFVFLGVAAAVFAALILTIFLFAALCAVVLPEPANRHIFDFFMSFLIRSHILLAYALMLYIIFAGVARWFFAKTTGKEAVTDLDRWQKIFTFLLYIASILILVSDEKFPVFMKVIFTVCFFMAVWQEKRDLNEYF